MSGSGGYQVVVEELSGLAKYFHDEADKTLNDVQKKITDLHLTGDKTGRCCPQAGDAVAKVLQAFGQNVQQYSTHLQDTGSALDATVKNYQSVDDGGASTLNSAGGRA